MTCNVVDSLTDNHCKKEIDLYGESLREFTHCVIMNSVPVKLCSSCHIFYEHLNECYETLREKCSDIYFDKDRINLVAATQMAFTSLWDKAFCDDCINNNNLDTFFDLNTNFNNCVNKELPCTNCLVKYQDLNSFYISLDEHNNGEVCFDIQDGMNRSRLLWSKDLKCCKRTFQMTYFLITSSICTIIPILFYFSMYMYTKRRERNHITLTTEDAEITGRNNSNRPSFARSNNQQTVSAQQSQPQPQRRRQPQQNPASNNPVIMPQATVTAAAPLIDLLDDVPPILNYS